MRDFIAGLARPFCASYFSITAILCIVLAIQNSGDSLLWSSYMTTSGVFYCAAILAKDSLNKK